MEFVTALSTLTTAPHCEGQPSATDKQLAEEGW
jgi:hypothetical protein